MDIITTCLILMLAVVVSSWVARAIPFGVPAPIIQIIVGVLIAKYTTYEVVLDPHVTFVLFFAVLLFLDGWRIPKDDLFKDAGTVLEMAIGLVFVTVLGLGYIIHLMIPTMPLPMAFALAAILAPTDPVAVGAITSKLKMPKRLHHILEGEALVNDASGLSAFRIAIAALITGHFSMAEAATEFAKMAIGGTVAGVLVAVVMIWVKQTVARRFGEEPGSTILISLLIPFAAFFAAEHYHFSGILAAAAAGVTMGILEMRGRVVASIRMRRNTVWDMIAFAANGVLFVILGEQFPKIWAGASRAIVEAGGGHKSWLIVYVLVITAMLLAVRFVWCWVSFRFTTFRRARRSGEDQPKVGWRLPAVATAAGVRGSITLAGIMTVPLVMPDGTPVPGRELAVLLAAGVIVTTMVFASLALPLLLKGLVIPEDDYAEKQEMARTLAARAAIRAIEERSHVLAAGRADADIYNDIAGRVMEAYKDRADPTEALIIEAAEVQEADRIERELRLTAIAAEREEVLRMGRLRKIPEAMSRKMVHELDLTEAKLAHGS